MPEPEQRAESVLPSPEEAAELVPSPESVTWRISGDARILTTAGYALMLQVAHPTVGAGVAEHSNFREDPWGRLFRTLDYTTIMVYGGPELAAETGRRVRNMHKHIKGTLPDGDRYYALEPSAYAWVHATLADAIVSGHRHFGLQLNRGEIETFYAEWRRLGRLVGVGESDLPENWAAFRDYFDRTVAEELVDNETVHDVVDSLAAPAAPPLPLLGGRVWQVARLPAARIGRLATIGLLPPGLRERLGLPWGRAQDLQLRTLASVSRRARPLMPEAARNFGPNYLRWRRDAIARGDVASGSRDPIPA